MSQEPFSRHIMVIEDDQDIRESITEALEMEGYRVKAAANGKLALELLRSTPAAWRPGFILLDLMMPVMNGWEFLLAQREDADLKKIPVLVCSAVADRSEVPGVVGYLKKPLQLDQLFETIAHYFNNPHGDHPQAGLSGP